MQDRISRRFIIWGFILFMIACALPTKDKFAINSGGQQKIISREDDPLIYWGADSAILIVAISLCAYGFFRGRKNN